MVITMYDMYICYKYMLLFCFLLFSHCIKKHLKVRPLVAENIFIKNGLENVMRRKSETLRKIMTTKALRLTLI